MVNGLIDPPNDVAPWGYDVWGEEIPYGEKVFETYDGYVPLAKADLYLEEFGQPVNTEE
ncbi:hypothetical protein [Weissella confusa]|uniref:hypothetical protein n=1 Tax=Weissella confusa TaxID=1583 RepID=UPI001436831D|nr:hypothetical protein [Weissella confusa]MBJ7656270.1 hypothetical protein [Weissella confusa]MBJ7658960.1 hypothetical protein [Weissella confusa]MBJ7681824.1 hypothetical protein [Weissella confusa]MBJ7684116.1 hypothetical protein [Weissella confusa]MBJ7702920.1 hypothetical protein [Weissella confusa]